MKTKVTRWGNSLALRLPKHLATNYQISEGSDVEFIEKAQGLLVKPVSRRKFQLDDLLKGVTKNITFTTKSNPVDQREGKFGEQVCTCRKRSSLA
jgi:antitoxin MazE